MLKKLIYALLPAYWHHGLATEMAQAVIAYAFTHGYLSETRARTDEPNHASARVMARLDTPPGCTWIRRYILVAVPGAGTKRKTTVTISNAKSIGDNMEYSRNSPNGDCRAA